MKKLTLVWVILAAVSFLYPFEILWAIDMRTVPAMTYEGKADVELKGRELEALEVALHQFRVAEFSTSGNLQHFTIELRRRRENLVISFFPEYDSKSSRGLPGRNKYGTYISYFVSMRSLKIVGYTFERD